MASRLLASRLLLAAERRAGTPELDRGCFHPYSSLFAVWDKHLPDVDAAKAAG